MANDQSPREIASDGSGSGVWSKSGDEWQLKWKSQFSGADYCGTGRMKATGKDTFTWSITDATKDGKAIADIPVTQCTKTDNAQASGLPGEYLKLLEKLIGEWNVELTIGGERITAECDFNWAPEGQCIEYRGVGPTGVPSCSGLGGWDPAKKQAVFTEYWNGGRQNTLCYAVVSPNVMEGDMSGTEPDGQATGGQIRVEFTGPDECVFTATKVVKGGKSQPDQKTVFHRK